jgi:hypothetical protein
MPKSYYADNTALNLFLRNTPFAPPAQTYLALFTVAPTPSGGGTEVSGNGYARQPVTFNAPSNGQCATFADVVFPVDIIADWTTVVAFGVFDAVSGGNLLYFANLSSSRYVAVNDQIKFPAGQIIATET